MYRACVKVGGKAVSVEVSLYYKLILCKLIGILIFSSFAPYSLFSSSSIRLRSFSFSSFSRPRSLLFHARCGSSLSSSFCLSSVSQPVCLSVCLSFFPTFFSLSFFFLFSSLFFLFCVFSSTLIFYFFLLLLLLHVFLLPSAFSNSLICMFVCFLLAGSFRFSGFTWHICSTTL